MLHWLGLNAATVSVAVVISTIVTWLLHSIRRELRHVADLLDTHTSGGLRDVLDALRCSEGHQVDE